MLEDTKNLNITLFCIDYALEHASLGVTQEQIAEAKAWVAGMAEELETLRKIREAHIGRNIGIGLDW